MTTHVTVRVSNDDGYGVPGSKTHCAIANALMLHDSDILYAKADRNQIRYSRRSTGSRYIHATPAQAAKFITEFDRGERPEPFTLHLNDDNLLDVAPRKKVNREQSIRYKAPGRKGKAAKAAKASPLRNRSWSAREAS